MKIFLSWSGEKSRNVAELLNDWLQCVIQAVSPWMSSKDIDRGALWFSEITNQLSNTEIGILCLTKENCIKPWILFEAGALAKGISTNRVCTLLIDLQSTDVENPLAQFNHTMPNKNGIWELVRTINLSLKDKSLKENVLEKVFETYWPQFENKSNDILTEFPIDKKIEIRSESDILTEVLSSIRSLDRRINQINNDKVLIGKNNIDRVYIGKDEIIRESDLDIEIISMLEKAMPSEVIVEIISDRYKLDKSLCLVKINNCLSKLNK